MKCWRHYISPILGYPRCVLLRGTCSTGLICAEMWSEWCRDVKPVKWYSPSKPKEEQLQHGDFATRPMSQLAFNIFFYRGSQFLHIMDVYSNFIFTRKMRATPSHRDGHQDTGGDLRGLWVPGGSLERFGAADESDFLGLGVRSGDRPQGVVSLFCPAVMALLRDL